MPSWGQGENYTVIDKKRKKNGEDLDSILEIPQNQRMCKKTKKSWTENRKQDSNGRMDFWLAWLESIDLSYSL